MVKWYCRLYTDGVVKKNKVKKAICSEKVTAGYYCICFASNEKNLFDIINTNELLFPVYKRGDLYILGLASTRKRAVELTVDIIKEVYQNTGGFLVRDYFKFEQ